MNSFSHRKSTNIYKIKSDIQTADSFDSTIDFPSKGLFKKSKGAIQIYFIYFFCLSVYMPNLVNLGHMFQDKKIYKFSIYIQCTHLKHVTPGQGQF